MHRRSIVAVGFLSLLTYLLVLVAMTISRVSYVVAARELSIVFSTVLGMILLKERHGRQRIAGSLLIFLGVLLIGAAR